MDATSGMMRVAFGKSRVRESREPGSVGAKAEWLSDSTTAGIHATTRRSTTKINIGVMWLKIRRSS